MALLGANYMTMMDLATVVDPSGKLLKIAEVLNRETGEILREAPYLPSNDLWTHKSARAASMPSGSRRKINVGITPSITRETPVLDTIGGFADYSDVDAALVDNNPEPAAFRLIRAKRFIQGIGQSVVDDIINGSMASDPDGINGFAARLDTIDSEFVFGAGGTGSDLSSIYVVTWGEDSVHLVYPKNMAGTKLGVKHEDLGRTTLYDANNKPYPGYRDYFEAWCGLVVADPFCLGRIANIETAGTTNTFDEDLLIKLLSEMRVGPSTRIYMNQTIMSQVRIRAKDKANMHWTNAGQALSGVPPLEFDGIPVRKIDKRVLLNTESAIS